MADEVLSSKSLPRVRLEVRLGSGGPTIYSLNETSFLLGTAPGCDLRLPGANLPPVIALIERHPQAVNVRKLSPLGEMLHNGQPFQLAALADGDRLNLGKVEILVQLALPTSVPLLRAPDALSLQENNELKEKRAALEKRARELDERQAQLERAQKELRELRQQFHQRYRKKRDRLRDVQDAIRQASQSSTSASSEMATLTSTFVQKARALEEEQRNFYEHQQKLQHEVDERLEAVTLQERELAKDREQLARSRTAHREELARLDRMASTLERKQEQLQKDALSVDRRFEEMQRTSRELEEQARQLDEQHAHLTQENERLEHEARLIAERKKETEQKAASLDGQQTMLASLRSRLERMRDEHRREEQQLIEQRAKQETVEVELQERLVEARRLQQELEHEKQLREEEQRQLEERKETMQQAVTQLRKAQEHLATQEAEVRQCEEEVSKLTVDCREQAALFEAKLHNLNEEKRILAADREALEKREVALQESQIALMTLQEQLRRRSEELEAMEEEREQYLAQRQKREQELMGEQERLRAREAEAEQTTQRLRQEEAGVLQAQQELEAERGRLEGEQASIAEQQERLRAERASMQTELQQAERQRRDLAAEVKKLEEQLPDLEERAGDALQRVTQSRDLLKEQLAETHRYLKESRSDLEELRSEAQQEKDLLWQKQQSLRESQDEHRLAVASFRQQLIEWQGRIQDLKQSVHRGESRLERRKAKVDEQAQQMASTAEQLQRKEQEVAEKHTEVSRHLSDMREWYRRKMRELARGGDDANDAGDESENVPLSDVHKRDILQITGELDPADHQLGELLHSLELVDRETLTALLIEARRQRRSLRQLLLAGGYLTLFQMALIEAGDLDGLVLGTVRVIDRLQSNAREHVYRVHDPRLGKEVLLRHLAEEEMQDAVHPDEFRQRFAAATEIEHRHVQATYEVIEIDQRPAVLQEWISGVPATEWSALAAVPGVWFRLISQAALGLQTIHQAGLSHGHLSAGQIFVTDDGSLKICGVGEPPWLSSSEGGTGEAADDLKALGEIARGWTLLDDSKRGSKPLPAVLQAVVARLGHEGNEAPITSASELLEELDRAGADVPANAAAWQRFLKQVREQSEQIPVRRSA